MAYETVRLNRLKKNKVISKNVKNRTKKVVGNSITKFAEKELSTLNQKPYNNFKLTKFMKKDGKDTERGDV